MTRFEMIQFAWPWLLCALPLPLLARLLPRAPGEVGAALRMPAATAVAVESTAARGPGGWRLWLALLAWVLLVVAAARPQWVGAPLDLSVAGRNLMLAVDISGSMRQADYVLKGQPVTRLDAVQAVAARFVHARHHDRLGLILFGSRAYLQTPLTFDGQTVATVLRDAVVGLAGRETAIGDAIALAVKQLREQPEGNRVLILMTDGENTAGALDPLAAARLAAQAGVRIYTIGIGGGDVTVRTPFGMRLLRQGTDYDPETLSEIAHLTGGRFFSATDLTQLAEVYQELDRLEPSARERQIYRPRQSLFIWPLGAALVLSVLLALAAWRQRA